MRRYFAPLVAALIVACAAETSSPAVADHFEVVQGGNQTGILGLTLDSLLRVRLVDDQGHPMPGVAVTWSVTSGEGSLPFSTLTTNATGEAVAQWHLGFGPGIQEVRVVTPGVEPLTVVAEAPTAEFTQLAVGNSFACGLDADGIAWCWGGGDYLGTLGTDSVSWTAIPLRIGDGSLQFAQLVAGDNFACGRTAAGAVWCWGARFYAQLGDGVGAGSSAPVQPTGLPALTSIGAGDEGTCGIAADATLWCWGKVAADATRPVPAPMFPGTSFQRIALGDLFGCGILSDSSVVCWGDNSSGQLGQGTLYCWGNMSGMPGHNYTDAARGTPTISYQDSPALRISLGYYCGAVWQSPSSPRLLCPVGYVATDIENLPSIIEFSFGYATLCLRAAGGVTYCKNYSDQGDPLPFAYEGTGVPAP